MRPPQRVWPTRRRSGKARPGTHPNRPRHSRWTYIAWKPSAFPRAPSSDANRHTAHSTKPPIPIPTTYRRRCRQDSAHPNKCGNRNTTRPQHQRESHPTVAQEQGQEHAHPERVGRMAGDEAVTASPVAIHHIDQIHKQRILRGSETGEIGFTEGRRELVGNDYGQRKEQDDQPCLAHGVVLDDQIKQHYPHRKPRHRTGDAFHQVVPKQRITPIEPQQELLVKRNPIFQTHHLRLPPSLSPASNRFCRLPNVFLSILSSNCL